jgi:hypothetical protein
MHVNRRDIRPVSMLEQGPVSRSMVLGGVLGVALAHVGAPLAFFAIISALAASGLASTEPETFVEEHIVEARFVRIGEKRDPDKLPDRKVPIKSTAPDDATVISKVNEPPPPQKPDAGVRPEKPEEDDLMRLGDRAQVFAEIAERREAEGDPNGVEDGTETEAQAGDLYAGQLREFFKRGWTIPTTLGDTSKLVAVVSVEITVQLKVGPFEVTRGSGEPLFDQSIEDRINELRTLGTTLPEPPPEVAAKFIGRPITLNFRGRGLQ